MANVSWINTTGGNWDKGANWSTGLKPKPADAVSIDTAAPATITHPAAINDTVASLSTAATDTLSISDGSLTVSGTATLAGAMDISGNASLVLDSTSTMASLNFGADGGALSIDPDATLTISGPTSVGWGTISGGTLVTSGATSVGSLGILSDLTWKNTGTLLATGGTLSGVTYDGALTLGDGSFDFLNQNLFVSGGLTLKNADGTGDGTVTLGGLTGSGGLIFDDSQTIDNAIIDLDSSVYRSDINNWYGGAISDDDTTGSGTAVLTLGSGLTVNASGPFLNVLGFV